MQAFVRILKKMVGTDVILSLIPNLVIHVYNVVGDKVLLIL